MTCGNGTCGGIGCRNAVLIKLSTYHSWFMTGDIPQEELEAGYPQGMPRYIRHTSGIPFTYVKQLMRFRTGAQHLAIETGRWARPKLPRQHRVCSKCSCTVVEDEVHFLFECPAYVRIREKYNTVLFAQFGGCQEASSTMKHNSDNVRLFMDQEPSLQSLFMNAWNFGGRRNVRTIILTLICHYSGMNGKVVFSIPFLLDQEVILLRHSLLMDQVPVFLPMEPRLAPYGRPL